MTTLLRQKRKVLMLPRNLRIPQHIKQGIKSNELGMITQAICAIGMDVETDEKTGKPLLLTWCDGIDTKVLYVNKENAFEQFMLIVSGYFSRKRHTVIGFHNLEFDLVALLPKQYFTTNKFLIEKDGIEITIYFGKTIWGVCRKKGSVKKDQRDGVRHILIIDTAKFFPYSLKKVSEDLRLPFRKMDYPGQGDWAEFLDYTRNDAKVQHALTEYIVRLHQKFDIRMTVSTPAFAQRLFRHKFVKKTIKYPPDEIAAMGFYSYHGGKNLMYAKSGYYKNVSDVDIVSCYASCMIDLPGLYGRWYKTTHILSPWGVYCVTAKIKPSLYPVFFSHNFVPLTNTLNRVCIAGPEAFKFKEFLYDIQEVIGWVFVPSSEENPLKDFALYLSALKQSLNTKESLYHFVKLLMNSVYGKFVQQVEIRNEIEKFNQAGGLFNPILGAWITSLARCKVYDLEHQYHSLDTSTDGIKTQAVVKESNEIGGVIVKGKYDYLLLRNKVCLAFDPENHHLVESASTAHGIFVKPKELLTILMENNGLKYSVRRMNRIRESLRRNLVPNVFRTEMRQIHLETLVVPHEIVLANS